jgi:hypothetical protein
MAMISMLIVCMCAAGIVYASDEGAVVRLQQTVESSVLCNNEKIMFEEYPQIAEKAGMKTIIFRSAESDEFMGYEGFFIKDKKTVKIFGLNLMAIYFEPDSLHFLALVNADKERILNMIKSNYPNEYSSALIIKYNDNYTTDRHTAMHMNNAGNNSNRIIIPIRKMGFSSLTKRSIEVESCSQTKSKWYGDICNMFEQKPLTWVGCTLMNDPYPCEKEDKINCIKRKLME